MLQAGPKTSALVVTPFAAAAGAAAGAGLAGADAAGALPGALLAGAVLPPQAVRDTVRAASAPTVANRKVFRTVFPPRGSPVSPGLSQGIRAGSAIGSGDRGNSIACLNLEPLRKR
jgi:hypothetical protein